MSRSTVSIENLSIRGASSPIVRGVSLMVDRGETLAVVGESGSGKSLTGRAMTGLLPSSLEVSGTLRIGQETVIDLAAATEQQWRAVRGNGIALLLQNPFTSLSPLRRVGAQIADTIVAHRGARRPSRGELRSSVLERLAEVRLPERVAKQFPHELSGGMRQRAAIAAALAADPEVLIADEPTTALDASTQGEILALINRLRTDRGMSVVLISHDLEVVRGHADEIVVMCGGSIVERGRAALVLASPAHPYTAGLLASSPSLETRAESLPSRPWIETAATEELPPGVTFGSGYVSAEELRASPPPRPLLLSDGRTVAVYSAEEIRPAATELESAQPLSPRAASVSAPDVAPVLTVSGLRKRFGDNVVLDDVSFDVRPREIVGILGESGSGKTTAARCIVGLESWDAGSIRPDPREPHGRGGGVQIVFQDPASALNPGHTIRTTLREALRAVSDRTTTPAEMLAKVGLPAHLLSRRPSALSGGQQQRVAIARALALRPAVLVCDESVSALDVSVQAQILRLLLQLREEASVAILFISHDLGVINHIADRVVVLNEGAIVEEGPTGVVLQRPTHPYTAHLVAAARATGTRERGARADPTLRTSDPVLEETS